MFSYIDLNCPDAWRNVCEECGEYLCQWTVGRDSRYMICPNCDLSRWPSWTVTEY